MFNKSITEASNFRIATFFSKTRFIYDSIFKLLNIAENRPVPQFLKQV
jgi:hypothetical protein